MDHIQAQLNAQFERLAESLRKEQQTDVDLLHIIGTLATSNARLGSGLAFHARDILGASTEDDTSYTEVIIEMFRRTFFDHEQAEKYDTTFFSRDPVMAKDFVDTILACGAADARGSVLAFSAYQSLSTRN